MIEDEIPGRHDRAKAGTRAQPRPSCANPEASRGRRFGDRSALTAELGVSDMTIRRDLLELEREGRLRRVHGGALENDVLPPVAMDSEEPSFEARLQQRRPIKEAIAAAAAEPVRRYRTIAIDVGTTTFLMAPHLRKFRALKVFTNSLRIATALDGTSADVYLAGGRIRRDEMSTVGPPPSPSSSSSGSTSPSSAHRASPAGFFDYSLEDSGYEAVYLRRSGRKVVLCDAAKFHRLSLVQVAPSPTSTC